MEHKMVSPKITIIVLNWNGLVDTLECLESVGKIDYPNFEVVVVDNGSTDDSPNQIRKHFPSVILFETGKNLGFAEGNNVGIGHALGHGAEYILLLNNDTVVNPQILNSFLDTSLLDPKAGILGAKIYYYSDPERIWYAGGKWDNKTCSFYHIGEGILDDSQQFVTEVAMDYACGCALFIRREVIEKIGLMEPDFFLLYEETDWCTRAIKAGYKCIYVPKAKVWHKISVSFGGESSPLYIYFFTRNKLLWAKRNLPLREQVRVHKLLYKSLFPTFQFSQEENIPFSKRVYWAFSRLFKDMQVLSKSPAYLAKLLGIKDYFLFRFGDCPEEVRRLRKLV
jgi:GT2 family glycosyltransferase